MAVDTNNPIAPGVIVLVLVTLFILLLSAVLYSLSTVGAI